MKKRKPLSGVQGQGWRFKSHTGGILRAREFGVHQKEVDIDISVMNCQIRTATPLTVRVN